MAWDVSQLHQKHRMCLSTLHLLIWKSTCCQTLRECYAIHSRSSRTVLQCSPAHQAPETVELLSHATPDFISPDHWPSNRPGLNPADYKSWVSCSKACTKQRSMTYKTLEAGFAITLNRESLLTLWLTIGATVRYHCVQCMCLWQEHGVKWMNIRDSVF